ncbi:MAG TPA: T9SS type A sorting domain-containing protein [Saprospiraceae bacterium]|nr:T9SS type A sorting domain-containing protein [Saprospiraceae bacterium]
MRHTIILLLFGWLSALQAQVNYTANDKVAEFEGEFGYGSNMGWYDGWTDQELADITAGNKNQGIKGIGLNTLRPWLPEWFLDYWGYDIRIDAFQHYKDLGIVNVTAFVGYPSDKNKDDTEYCPGEKSLLFKNLYSDIWDNGENGTPVNDTNYYALYLYNMVQKYKFNVKFWEILNEPDFDFVGNSSTLKDDPKSWWNVNPEPCELALKAPVTSYIRMLRISYEVIKYLDPDAYVSIAGLGYPSFLDAVLRQTDNPNFGATTPDYPLQGGAYFDVMCFHSYPHIDGNLRYWSDAAGGFVYTRHSDAAKEGLVHKRNEFDAVLKKYGYDGKQFPEKKWIITESNIPRKAFGEYMGSDEAQRNFTIKALVECQKIGIIQFQIYSLAETKDYKEAKHEFELMGLFKNINNISKDQTKLTDQGIAFKTTTSLLKAKKFDKERTEALALPSNIDGAAFVDSTGKYVYVLWAKTTKDRSEKASATYAIPKEFRNGIFEIRYWDYGITNSTGTITGKKIQLTGSPVFISETSSNNEITSSFFRLKVLPNPIAKNGIIHFLLQEDTNVSITLFDTSGKKLLQLAADQTFPKGKNFVDLNIAELPLGIYFVQLKSKENIASAKIVKQ